MAVVFATVMFCDMWAAAFATVMFCDTGTAAVACGGGSFMGAE